MSAFLPNTTTTDKYTDTQLGGQTTPYDRGQLLIANNPVSLVVFRGADRSSITQDEYGYVTPTLVPLVRGDKEFVFGVQIKSAISGSPAQVSGFLVEPGLAGLGAGSAFTQQVAAGGGVTPGVASVQIQKNGVLIGTEPILDFIDANGFKWSIADDAANTRVTLAPPKIVTGIILGAGVINSGTGFTCVRNAAGNYTITFTSAFAASPYVGVTTAGTLLANVPSLAPNAFTVGLTTPGGVSTDAVWWFTAMDVS